MDDVNLGLDGGYLLLVGQRFGSGCFDLRQFQVDGFPSVVEGGRLQDDPCGTHQDGNSEDP